MHLTRAIPYIALTLFARKSSRKCHTVRTFGLTVATKAEEEKDDGNKEAKEEEEEEKETAVWGKEEIVSGRYAKNSKLFRRGRGRERPTVTGATGNRKRSGAAAYNLKTHSAFKLLTMATGYKVLCRYHGEREARRGFVRVGGGTSAIQKFDLFERRLRTARRRDGAGGQIGGRF